MTMSLDEKQSQILGTQQSKEIMREWTLNESCAQWLWAMCVMYTYILRILRTEGMNESTDK